MTLANIVEKLKISARLFVRLNDKDLITYAASLSFHTIMAIIPILLISFSIFTKMPNFQEYYNEITSFIFSSLLPSQESAITEYINKFLENTTQMGIFGFVAVLVVSMLFFQTYENIFNRIMHTSKRSFWQSLSSYWTLVTLAPILLGVSLYLSNIIQAFLEAHQIATTINFLGVFPYLVVWTLFFTTYMISSSAKISFKAGIFSSFIASLVWYLSKTLFVFYVAYNKTYLSIYGSFSIALFFFVWIYFSWVIFLYGARVCYILNGGEFKKKEIAPAQKRDREHKNPPKRAAKRGENIEPKQP